MSFDSLSLPGDELVHALGRFAFELGKDMGVGVHGQRNLGVPEDLHHNAGMHALG